MTEDQLAHRHPDHPLDGVRIGVFGKGGSGKSTVTVLLARALADSGYRVVVLDADSTNIGLAQALGAERPPWPLLGYFGGMVFSGGLVTCPVDDPRPLEKAEVSLEELPEAYQVNSPQGITLLEAGKIGSLGPGAGCDGPVAKIARDVRLVNGKRAPVTLIDFKAGFEDAARGVILGLDWLLIVVDPTRAAVQMAVDLTDTVTQIRRGALPATQHLEDAALVQMANQLYQQASITGVCYVMNKVGDPQTAAYLRQRLAEEGITVDAELSNDPGVTRAWLQGQPLRSDPVQPELRHVIRRLEAGERQHQAIGV